MASWLFPLLLLRTFSLPIIYAFLVISYITMIFSTLAVLVTSLRLRRSSATISITPQGDTLCTSNSSARRDSEHRRGNSDRSKLARLGRFCASATGATIRRFAPGRTCRQPEASSTVTQSIEHGSPTWAFLSPNPDSSQRLRPTRRIECHPSAISPAVEPLGAAQPVVMNPRPYFVPSTASASEILTNVAIQDLLENEDAGFYELSCHPTSTSTLASVSDSWDSFDFLVPSAYEDHSGSDSDLDLEPVDVEEGPVSPDDSPQSESATESTGSTPTSRFPGLGHSSVPSSANINNTRRLFSPSVVVVALWNARPDSPPGGNDCDDEEVIMVPSASFPHPHRLATIIEEEEDPPSPESDDEDEDDTSDTETIRPSSVLGCPGLPVDMGMDQPAGDTGQKRIST